MRFRLIRKVNRVWILNLKNDIYICSYCGNEAYWDTDYGQQLFDYCPYCGEYNRIKRNKQKDTEKTKGANY